MNVAAIYRAVLVRGEHIRLANKYDNNFLVESWPAITPMLKPGTKYYAEITNPDNDEHRKISVESYSLTPRHSGYPNTRNW
jgi:hypothetical protein